MTNKIAYFAFAVVFAVAMAAGMVIGTAGAALADNEGAGYGTMDSSFSSEPEMGVANSDAGEIREPVETGAVPDRPESSSDLYSSPQSDESTVEHGWAPYRPDIDAP